MLRIFPHIYMISKVIVLFILFNESAVLAVCMRMSKECHRLDSLNFEQFVKKHFLFFSPELMLSFVETIPGAKKKWKNKIFLYIDNLCS